MLCSFKPNRCSPNLSDFISHSFSRLDLHLFRAMTPRLVSALKAKSRGDPYRGRYKYESSLHNCIASTVCHQKVCTSFLISTTYPITLGSFNEIICMLPREDEVLKICPSDHRGSVCYLAVAVKVQQTADRPVVVGALVHNVPIFHLPT